MGKRKGKKGPSGPNKQQQQQQKQQQQVESEQHHPTEEQPPIHQTHPPPTPLQAQPQEQAQEHQSHQQQVHTKIKGQQPQELQSHQKNQAEAALDEQSNQSNIQPKTELTSKVFTKETYGGDVVGGRNQQLEPPNVGSVKRKVSICRKSGKQLLLQVNHFQTSIRIPNGTIYHYDVDFKMRNGKEPRKSQKRLLIKAIEEIKKKHQRSFGKPFSIVFDGKKNIYSCQQILTSPFQEKIEVKDDETERLMEITVNIQPVASHEVTDLVNGFLQSGTTKTQPTTAVQILNIILGMTPLLRYECIGRSHFNPTSQNKGSVVDIGNGKSLWIGTFQSVRLGWKPMLNVDVANRPAYEEQSVEDFSKNFLFGANPSVSTNSNSLLNLQEQDKDNLNNELKQLKMLYRRPDNQIRHFRINGIVDSADRKKVDIEGKKITVKEYFSQHYKYNLKHPGLPCLHVGGKDKTVYLPMELCWLKKQLAPESKKLNEEQLQNIIKVTAKEPAVRKQKIMKNLKDISNAFKEDPYAKAFGISIRPEMEEIPGRILNLPALKYKQGGKDVEFSKVNPGWWKMGNNQFLSAKCLDCWGFLDLTSNSQRDSLKEHERDLFIQKLYEEGQQCGFQIEFPFYEKADAKFKKNKVENLDEVERKFKKLYEKVSSSKGKPPQLIMVIVPRKSDAYACLKFCGDAELNVPTQFINKKNTTGRGGPNMKTLHNICLKLNAKIGGTNHGLFHKPPVMKKPVVLLGADVTHSAPASGEATRKPSIAAMVGSCNPEVSEYICEVRVQDAEDNKVVEEIKKTEEMVYNILLRFYRHTKKKPQNIIYYRDGVSEGQFLQVLNKELGDIRKACARLNKDYQPKVTFMVAQKRHHTRLFVKDERDGVGKMKNIPPGTVVDRVITHPTEYDFFLASHEGIQGTTKPTHYHLLWDDADFTMDELQTLTFNLCHLYSRCEKSVSYPAPTYYAHLAAARAREHHNALLSSVNNDQIKIRKEDLKKIEELKLLNYFM